MRNIEILHTILILSLSVIGFTATSAMASACQGCGTNTLEMLVKVISDYDDNNVDYGYPDTPAKSKVEDALDITFVVAADDHVNADSCKSHDTDRMTNTGRKGFKSCDDIGADNYLPANIDDQRVLILEKNGVHMTRDRENKNYSLLNMNGPEPEQVTMVLLGIGLSGLAARLIREKQKK